MAQCPICGEDPGFYINGEPFCVLCTSLQPCAIGQSSMEGRIAPIVGVRFCAAVEIVLALVVWVMWEIHWPIFNLLRTVF